MSSILLSKEDVLRFLPHRDPFLFIDTVTSIEIPNIGFYAVGDEIDKNHLVGSIVLAQYQVDERMTLLQGHFPGNPIVPGVIQVEMMAQASAFSVMALTTHPFAAALDVSLIKVEGANFRKPIRPGMNLTIKALCVRLRKQMMSHEAWIYHEGEMMAETSLFAMASFSV